MRPTDWLRGTLQLANAMRTQWLDPAALRHLQGHALARQLRHAAETVPHYREVWAARGIDWASVRDTRGLARFPLTRREEIQASPEAFLSETGDRSTWRGSRTSGSTGTPLESRFDAACWTQARYALKLRRFLAAGWRPGLRLTLVEALEPNRLGAHAARLALPGERWLGTRYFLSLFESTERHIACYERVRPHFIYAPPSYLVALAEMWGDGLRAHVPLRALMTSAEWIHPKMRDRLREVFGVPVLDVYGSTEFKEIAWQCAAGHGYHVNMESVAVEIFDDEGRSVPSGQSGQVIVTSLTNRAMPLIRYATGDRARRLAGICECGRGSELLEGIEGRTVDHVLLRGGRLFSPYQLTTALEGHPEVRQYKITQRASNHLDVALVLHPGSDPPVARIRRALERMLGAGVHVTVRSVASIPREPSGKHRPVQVARGDRTERPTPGR